MRLAPERRTSGGVPGPEEAEISETAPGSDPEYLMLRAAGRMSEVDGSTRLAAAMTSATV
jgi:hypothetical protein